MGAVNVSVNGHGYVVGCDDGQEPHVEALAREFDAKVREVSAQVGKVTELRLFLMAALVLADEASEGLATLVGVEPPGPAAPVGQADERCEQLIEPSPHDGAAE